MSKEETQGPYWFDVDSIRGDIREDRPGTTLQVAMRVQDNSQCNVDGSIGAVSNAVVEIWHCGRRRRVLRLRIRFAERQRRRRWRRNSPGRRDG